jgi:CRP/FNR family cyclic AMP-dependent transcriptional regulator
MLVKDVLNSLEESLDKDFGCAYPQGSVIFNENDPGHLVFIIQSGRIEIRKAVGDRQKVLAQLGRGDFFGEMALISDRPRSATATAVEDCRLLALKSDTFFRILRTNYDVTVRIIEQLAARLAESDRRLEVLLFTDATSRLVRFLESTPAQVLEMDLEGLAYELGLPLERLQHIARKFEEKGIIRVGPSNIAIADRDKLAKLKGYLLLKDEFGKID